MEDEGKKKLETVVTEETKKRPKRIKQKPEEVPWSEQVQLRRTPKATKTELKNRRKFNCVF